MRRLPWSLSWFALTGIIFLLQLFPLTGIFLMLVAAPLWSILTVNIGFVSLGIEAALGGISRRWLIAPLVWFGGYALAAHESQRALDRLDAEIRAGNQLRTMAFNPAREVVVFTANANDLGGAAGRLVREYRVPVAYTDQGNSRQSRRANELPRLDPGFRAERLGSAEVCRRLQADPRPRAANATAHFLRESADRRAPISNLCAYSFAEEPQLPVVRVEAKAEKLRGFLLTGKVVKITITAPDGDRLELRSGQAAALMRWPMPAMGCALNSGRPAWECDAGFMRGKPKGLGGSGAWGAASVEVVARALSLEASPALSRQGEIEATDTTALDRTLERHEGATLANLDRVLQDPTLRATVHDLAGLVERPALLASRADAMLEAMSAALAHGRGSSETARNLQRLVAALPETDFRRVGDELIRRLEEGRPRPDTRSRRPVLERLDGSLATRLGDLGARALPLLERLAFEPRGESAAYATLGLCRMGEAAAGLATRVADHVAAAGKNSRDLRAAAYVSLVRWGRIDLAETLVEPENTRERRDYARRWPSLSPASGPEVCTLRYRA